MKGNIDFLWKKYKITSCKNLEKKIFDHFYFIIKNEAKRMTKKYNKYYTENNLISFGYDGLISAIRCYEKEKNDDFVKYASMRVRGAILDGMRKDDHNSRNIRQIESQIEKVKEELKNSSGILPTQEEIYEKIGVTYNEVSAKLHKYNPLTFFSLESNDEDLKEDYNSTLIDKKVFFSDIEKRELFWKLTSKGFSKKEKDIIYLYFFKERNMKDISNKLEISESSISQYLTSITGRLKDKIKRNPKYFENIL